jgi:la-related protein 1
MSASAVPFSYAQAAKGLTSTGASVASSRSPSGNITPAKDGLTLPPLTSEIPAGTSWADDAETGPKDSHSSATTAVDAQSSPRIHSPVTHASAYTPNGVTSPSSPDFGASSTSTLAREDDAISIPITSSESTWENKSQSSTVADKPLEVSEKEPSKGRKKSGSRKNDKAADKAENEKTWFKPLQEAPIPPVNIWALRAQEAKSKVPAKPIATSQPTSAGVDTSSRKLTEAAPVAKATTLTDGSTMLNGDVEAKGAERMGARNHGDEKSTRREARGNTKAPEKTERSQKAAPLLKDESSWPTPDTIKEDERKPPPQPEKTEKDASVSTPTTASKKKAWANLPFTPTVVFNTPLPGSNPRRGGRAARGAREQGGRGGASAANGEKSATSQSSNTNGEGSRRGRPEPAVRNASPVKTKRSASGEPATRKDPRAVNGIKDGASKDTTAGSDAPVSKVPVAEEESRHHTFPRQNNPVKPRQNRRTDVPLPNGEKRKENEIGGEIGSKENESEPASRRTSIPNQGDGE